MKANKSTPGNPIHRLLLTVPVISSMAFAACSDVAGTAENKTATSYRVATYLAQPQEKTDSQPVDSDSDPSYEWFY